MSLSEGLRSFGRHDSTWTGTQALFQANRRFAKIFGHSINGGQRTLYEACPGIRAAWLLRHYDTEDAKVADEPSVASMASVSAVLRCSLAPI
jgi:hypothetical protein